MLGSIVGRPNWTWTLWGKHPAVKDFISRGLATPVEQASSTWVEKGFGRLSLEESQANRPCTWRFWIKGSGNHRIACGNISNSGDRLGRPYPLLIMGSGKLSQWKDHWEYLPVGLDRTWRQMERLSALRTGQFEMLQTALDKMESPVVDWPEVITKMGPDTLPETDRLNQNEVASMDELMRTGQQLLPLGKNPQDSAMIWHYQNKKHGATIPTALFMGGAVDHPHLAVYLRAVSPADFVSLWTVVETN